MGFGKGRVLAAWSPRSSTIVRRRLRRELANCGLRQGVIDDALLVVGELVANAVRFGQPLPGQQIEVLWWIEPGRCWVGVTGTTRASAPVVRPVPADSVAGRGLQIVNTVAEDWGVRQTRGRTTIWAALSTEGPDQPEPSPAVRPVLAH